MLIVIGWRYWYQRYLGWVPFQMCMLCQAWYWGGLPFRGWRASMKEFCSKKCHEEGQDW